MAGCSGSSSSSSPPPPPVTTPGNPVGSNLTQVSSDPYAVGPGQHATEVEPHMLANGTTLVAAFQTGRIVPGGATDIGWATSTDSGTTWSHGFLPGLTTGEGSGPYDAASDPAVAYDAKHGVWMIASLPLSNTSQTPAVVVSRSTDGLTWQSPISADPTAESSDKNWIVCDSWASSPHYGNCYLEWDDPINSDEILMSTSADGGLTWGPATATANLATGIGGQPLVQPNGTVIVPIETNSMSAFISSDGGMSWTAPVTISNVQFHADAGGIRSGPLPSAAIDGAGTVWVVWEDCRFRSNCSTNDLVYSTSTDGVNWTAVTRIPIDDTSSTVDHFIPGIGIDPATSGAGAHVALHYYYYSQSDCTVSTCQLLVGYISSANGGATLECTVPAYRADAAQLAAEFAERVDGRGLHCHRLHQWRASRSIRGGVGNFGNDLQRGDLHGAGTDGEGRRSAVVVGRGQAAAQAFRQDREGASGEGRDSAVAAPAKREVSSFVILRALRG